jgi:hypothetical protein
MRKVLAWMGVVLLAAGCAGAPRQSVQRQGEKFTGEVWVWDEQRNTVTLRRYTEIVRVKVTPDQLRGLRHHETGTVWGEVEESAPIQLDRLALAIAEPRGPADVIDLSGTIAAVENGRVRISSPQGSVDAWTAPEGIPLRAGDPVQVEVRVQPLETVQVKAGDARPTAAPDVAAPTRPGPHAAVRGLVVDAQPSRLTVDSPRGPLMVVVPPGARYRIGDAVEVRTAVYPAR